MGIYWIPDSTKILVDLKAELKGQITKRLCLC